METHHYHALLNFDSFLRLIYLVFFRLLQSAGSWSLSGAEESPEPTIASWGASFGISPGKLR